jgi:hypothetical protein
MFSRSLGLITGIGPATSVREHPDTTKATDFAIEVEMMDGDRALLELSRNAAIELAEQLAIYMRGRGSP